MTRIQIFNFSNKNRPIGQQIKSNNRCNNNNGNLCTEPGFSPSADDINKCVGKNDEYCNAINSVKLAACYQNNKNCSDGENCCDIKMETCTCKDDPQKDGCYHCLYGYRQSRNIGSISRTVALNMFRQIVSGKDNRRLIKTINKILKY